MSHAYVYVKRKANTRKLSNEQIREARAKFYARGANVSVLELARETKLKREVEELRGNEHKMNGALSAKQEQLDGVREERDRYRAALEEIAADFGTDHCDGNTMIAREALAVDRGGGGEVVGGSKGGYRYKKNGERAEKIFAVIAVAIAIGCVCYQLWLGGYI